MLPAGSPLVDGLLALIGAVACLAVLRALDVGA